MKNSKTNLTKEQRIIQSYTQVRDPPTWFRALSVYQREAADSLSTCIRDDFQQSTTHRVRDALRRIGIEPPVGPSKIKLVMRLSRGNDLAFLWFLMELYYRKPEGDPCEYSFNEQIFLTAIAYLDTIPTLRVLDRILPKKLEKNTKEPQPVKQKRKCNSCNSCYPYFQKQPRPIECGKDLTLEELPCTANLAEYEHCLNPYYCVQNLKNRWFKDYKFKKCRGAAKDIIDDKVDRIPDELLENDTLTEHHQNLETLKESMENACDVAKKLNCEKYFDVEAYFKDKSYKRVMGQINNELEKIATTRLEEVQRRPLKGKNESADKVPAKIEETWFVTKSKCCFCKAPFFHMEGKDPVKALNEIDNEIDRCKAVKKISKKLWSEEVKANKLEYEEEQKPLNSILVAKPDENIVLDKPDEAVISAMLMKALQGMKKDKSYVLASLPEAHKWPIIKQWTRKRYGKHFKKDDRIREFQESKKVFHALRKNALDVPCLCLNNLSQRRIISYRYRDYLLKKSNYLLKKYHNNFKDRFLEDARVYWSAIRPYQCPNGPPRNVFFAYLPATKNNIHMFRPWKNTDFINAKAARDKRQRNKYKK